MNALSQLEEKLCECCKQHCVKSLLGKCFCKKTIRSDTESGQDPEPIQRIASLNRDHAAASVRLACLISTCTKQSTKYTDFSFPANDHSLYYDINSPFLNESISWKRPDQIQTNIRWTVIGDPHPWNIIQGDLGDCWLISALAVISEQRNLIEKVILTRNYCSAGIYIIRLCIDGLWTNVTLDDYLPVDATNKIVFSKAHECQLYVSLIEKAVAKSYGCYEAIIKGHCVDGLAILTGAPCESIFLKQQEDEDKLWYCIIEWRRRRYPMSCSCGNSQMSQKSFAAIGLHPYHAYCILDVEEIKGTRLLKLRNPWGTTSWKGQFSIFSNEWTRSLLENHNPKEEASRGVFLIPLQDFRKYFNSIDVCYIEPNSYEVRYRYKSEVAIFDILVSSQDDNCECRMMLHQKQQRNRNDHVDLLIYIESNNASISRSRRVVRESFTSCTHLLSSGKHRVVCISTKRCAEYYTFVVHSNRKLLIRRLSIGKDSREKNNVIERVLVNIAKKAPSSSRLEVPKCNGTIYQLTENMSGLLIVAVNRHKNLSMMVKCDCKDSINVIGWLEQKEPLLSTCIVQSGKTSVVQLLTHKDTSRAFVVSSHVVAKPTR